MAQCHHQKDRRCRGSPLLPLVVVYAGLLLGGLSYVPPARGDPNVGAADVDLDVALLFRISGIENVSFGSYAGHGGTSRTDDVCVWTNASSGRYKVTARGRLSDDAFLVEKQGDAMKTIEYGVEWITDGGTIALTAGQASADRTGANTVSTSCLSGPSAPASYRVSFAEDKLLAVPAGYYTGVLRLIISAPSS